jgi:N-acetylglucosamine-6-phosphate deacetylase
MSGFDHHEPGLAVAALITDAAWVELIADGHHVDPALWPLVSRAKPGDRLVLVSDAIAIAGTGDRTADLGVLAVEVHDGRCTLVDGGAWPARYASTPPWNLVRSGHSLPAAVAAAGATLAMLGSPTAAASETGQLADLVEFDDDLHPTRDAPRRLAPCRQGRGG